MILVNLGCGRCTHRDWVNLDVEPLSVGVRRWDVRRPLPFENESIDMVYHSHLLEHLTPEEGRGLLKDCHRVLRRGGIIRVVVPNLAGIAEAYLSARELALQSGDPTMLHWTRMELTDQVGRARSGGEMASWLRGLSASQAEQVRKRAGVEVDYIRVPSNVTRPTPTLGRIWKRIRREVLETVAFVLGGPRWSEAVAEGLFRQSGEVHRTMYDDVRLLDVLRDLGFEDARVVDAWTSGLPEFKNYGLDTIGEHVRKPDSLFMEARKG